MEATVEKQVAKLVDLIESKYVSTNTGFRPMDFAEKTQYFTLDVISDLGFGHAFGFLEEDRDVYDYIKITKSFVPILATMANVPLVIRVLQSWPLKGLFPKESDKIGFGAFIGLDVPSRFL